MRAVWMQSPSCLRITALGRYGYIIIYTSICVEVVYLNYEHVVNLAWKYQGCPGDRLDYKDSFVFSA